jgi:hypothetical protein
MLGAMAQFSMQNEKCRMKEKTFTNKILTFALILFTSLDTLYIHQLADWSVK